MNNGNKHVPFTFTRKENADQPAACRSGMGRTYIPDGNGMQAHMQLLYCVPCLRTRYVQVPRTRDWMICQNRRRKQAQVWGMRDPNAVVSSRYMVHIGYTDTVYL